MCPSAPLSTPNAMWIDLGSFLCLCGEGQATNHQVLVVVAKRNDLLSLQEVDVNCLSL